jgi:hypothetical protein
MPRFAPGNTVALRHGARSPRVVQKRAAEVRDELATVLVEHLPYLTPGDRPLLDLTVDATAKLRLVAEHLDRTSGGSLLDLRGRPRSCAGLYLQLVRQSVQLFDRLGLGPAARASVLGSLGLTGIRHDEAVRQAQERLRRSLQPVEGSEATG